MARVPANVQGAGKKQLRPDVAGNAELLIITVAKVEFREEKFGPVTVITSEEFEDNELRIRKRGTDRLVAAMGDDTDKWLGKRVPLRKVHEEMAKGYVYQVALPEEWPALLKAGKKATR